MNIKIFVILILSAVSVNLSAQKYFARNAHIDFFSHTSIEDIKGENETGTMVIDAATGQIEVACTIKSFEFEKALMQEHFNENYLESNTFPSSTFKGKIEQINLINFTTDGQYESKATGTLTMHGVSKVITVPVKIEVKAGKITGHSEFTVNPKDYNITIPSTVKQQISESIAISVHATLAELKR